jgi:integrase
VKHLRELYKITGKTPWCFPADKNDGHVDEKTIGKQVRDRQRSIPMKNRSKAVGTLTLSGGTWTPHDLRRTAARMMGNTGTDPMTVEACINHVMEKLKRTYQKAVPWESKREAWNRLGKHLELILAQSV